MPNEANVCKECGAELTTDSPHGLCPKCLLKQGLVASGSEVSDQSSDEKTVIEPQRTGPRVAGQVSSVEQSAIRIPQSALGKVRYFGDYELLEEIARGGMGVVYKARQVSLNRIVTVKMIFAGQLASDAEVKRFRTEAEAAANLQHPNIVAIHEVGEHEGQHYFSMDYVQGKQLGELVREGPLPAGRAAALVKTIAKAIQYAHQRGILHRDLKPQNVLIDEFEQPRITDFGLARRMERDSSLTRTGAVMGSPSYMPPEQAAGRQDRVGPHSDVYSLGAILYQLLTGQAPFAAETPMATLMKVLEEEPKAPMKLNPRVPPDLDTICLKCLEKRPERRYATARDLAEELNRFLNHEPIQARPARGLRTVWIWGQRHPWAITGAISLVSLALFWFAYAMWVRSEYLLWEKLHPGQLKKLMWASDKPVEFISLLGYGFIYFVAVLARPPGLLDFRRCVRRRVLEGIPVPGRTSLTFGAVCLALVLVNVGIGCWFINEYFWRNRGPSKLSPYSAALLMFVLGIVVLFVWRCVSLLRGAIREHYFLLFLAPEESARAKRVATRQEQEEQEEYPEGHVGQEGRYLVAAALLLSVVGTFSFGAALQIRSGWDWAMLATCESCVVGFVFVSLAHQGPRVVRIAVAILCPLVFIAWVAFQKWYLDGSLLHNLTASLIGFIMGGAFARILAGERSPLADVCPWHQRLVSYFRFEQLGTTPLKKLIVVAQSGDVEAQATLAHAYFRGVGCKPDKKQALHWFLQAAESGHAEAQLKVAKIFDRRASTSEDLQKAAAWYRRAALQGVPAAQRKLGRMYWDGRGVPKDLVEAYMWLELAECDAHNYETDLDKEMTPAQIAEAERRVDAFRPKKERAET